MRMVSLTYSLSYPFACARALLFHQSMHDPKSNPTQSIFGAHHIMHVMYRR